MIKIKINYFKINQQLTELRDASFKNIKKKHFANINDFFLTTRYTLMYALYTFIKKT